MTNLIHNIALVLVQATYFISDQNSFKKDEKKYEALVKVDYYSDPGIDDSPANFMGVIKEEALKAVKNMVKKLYNVEIESTRLQVVDKHIVKYIKETVPENSYINFVYYDEYLHDYVSRIYTDDLSVFNYITYRYCPVHIMYYSSKNMSQFILDYSIEEAKRDVEKILHIQKDHYQVSPYALKDQEGNIDIPSLCTLCNDNPDKLYVIMLSEDEPMLTVHNIINLSKNNSSKPIILQKVGDEIWNISLSEKGLITIKKEQL